MKNAFIIILAGIIFLSVLTFYPVENCVADGTTIYVDDDGGAGIDYTNIQDAIDAATSGDLIYVYSGTYTENIEIDKSLTLNGYESGAKTIKGAASGHVVEITADYVNISGFRIQEPQGADMKCIMMNKVQNCRITSNIIQSSSDDGIYLFDSDYNTINGNTISDNDENGIKADYSSNNNINSNQLNNNKNGINIGGFSYSNEIYDNTLAGKSGIPQGYGINFGTSTSGNIVYRNSLNDFSQNGRDISTGNTWYKSSTQEGNYWDDYTDIDANDDGIGDTPYSIAGGSNQDIYPLGYFVEENQPPVAVIQSISPNPATAGQTVTFNGLGLDDGSINAWEWKVDGSIVAISEDFSSSGFSVGTHSVTFRVQDNDLEWSQTISNTFTITASGQQNNPPTVTLVHPEVSKSANFGDSVYFYGIGQDPDQGDIVSYSWSSSKDGLLSGEQYFYKSDLTGGTHTITLRVTDNHGAYAEETRTLVINPDPNVENDHPVAVTGGPYAGVVNSSVSFDGSNSYDPDDGDSITDYSWDFGDGAKGSGETAEHTYSISGEYTVQLTVTDSHGEQHTSETTVNIAAESNGQGGSGNDKWVIPGFEVVFIILAIAIILFYKREKGK